MHSSPTGKKPTVCITSGDPRGIGPEVTKKALSNKRIRGRADFIVFNAPEAGGDYKSAGRASVDMINRAFALLRAKNADALVTGPVSKKDINRSGIRFEGHTEYLAGLCGIRKFAMLFVSDELRVSVVTRHIALKDVSRAVTEKAVYDTAELTCDSLRRQFRVKNPRVGISGLNPHCGEGGLFGKEEKTVIEPAVRRLKKKFRGVVGPVPADALLRDVYRGRLDAAVCMYHDQALAAFKMVAMEKGVNVTLGLPFVRTSVDHGTAFDIAGKGIADAGSMIAAIELALKLVAPC